MPARMSSRRFVRHAAVLLAPLGTTLARTTRLMDFHRQGARAANRKVVETGWELGAAAPTSRVKPDDDLEPARPAPAAATPAASVREFATKEVPEALAYCQKDKTLEGAFDCYRVQRAVYNYRMAHAADGTPEPLATLLSGDKLDCGGCVDQFRTPGWAKQQAHAQGLKPAVVECIGQRIVSAFQAKPYLNRIKEAYAAAVAACKR